MLVVTGVMLAVILAQVALAWTKTLGQWYTFFVFHAD